MPDIMLFCTNCQHIFKSGIFLDAGAKNITFINNKSQCPNCGSMENIPDGTFSATVDGFIEIIKGSKNPLQEALDILNGLKNIKDYKDLNKLPHGDKIESFLQKNQMKITVAIAILSTIISLISKKPDIELNQTIINQNFYNSYNQTVEIKLGE